jgi:hypothetical protein
MEDMKPNQFFFGRRKGCTAMEGDCGHGGEKRVQARTRRPC